MRILKGAGTRKQVALTRALTAKDGFTIVVGSVIGSGIFLVPGFIAMQLASLRAVLLVWFCGALLSVFGAVSLAEMGSMFPGAGGLYIYLRRSYGRPVAFLYGWGLLTMIQTGTIATLGAGFALYLSRVIGFSPVERKVVGAASIVALTGINLLGVHTAKHLQNASTVAKIAGLVLLGLLLFWRGHVTTLGESWRILPELRQPLPFGVALIAVLWAYEGWHVVSFTAGEFLNPGRDLPKSLIFGTAVVGAIYVVMNLAYYAVLGPAQIRGTGSAAASAVAFAYGADATHFVSILILISILGAMNGMVLTGPRVYYAMALEGDFLPMLGRLDSRFHAPALAIIVQGIWAAALILLGSFQQLYTHVIFTAWIFYGLAVGGVIVLRVRFPHLARPFRAPGYPLIPLLFMLASAAVVVSTIVSQPRNAIAGILLMMLGIPVYFVFSLQHRPNAQLSSALREEAGE
ncbi:MAG: amino acid permease [Terracidiphilus sp.]